MNVYFGKKSCNSRPHFHVNIDCSDAFHVRRRRGMGEGWVKEMWESERRKREEKIRWNLFYPFPRWFLWYVQHCIMICKYDKIWKWYWAGKSGLMHCFQSFENAFQSEESFSFASYEILIQPSPPFSVCQLPSQTLSPSLQIFSEVLLFLQLFSPCFWHPSPSMYVQKSIVLRSYTVQSS